MINLGNDTVNKIYLGNDEVNKIYLGDVEVYNSTTPPPPTPYEDMYLTFNIISGGSISWRASSTAYTKEIFYQINDGEWTSIVSTTAGTPINLSTGDIVRFKGDGAISTGQNTTNRFRDSTIVFNVYGNIMSLIDSTGYTTATTAADHSFRQLFASQTGLTSAENLVLPATTIGTNVYKEMFKGCTSLTTAPVLPATTLAQSCYMAMFSGCTSLTTAPELPASTLAQECYRQMFFGCTSLTTAPSSIGTSASTVGLSGCTAMFSNCSSLTTAPELPAETLTNNCYFDMFYGCTSLTTAPSILPATTLAESCYGAMFYNCSSLITTPELPATTLAESCYGAMFRNCTGLTTAPTLPATNLPEWCYSSMFAGCTSLSYIKCLATDISARNCTNNWVNSVSSTGTFVKSPNMSSWTTGVSGIPNNWTVEDA